MMSSFTLGSNLKMRIMKHKTPCLVQGRVAYSSGGMGMGVRFTEVAPEQVLVLEKWINELSGVLPFDDEESIDGLPALATPIAGNETSYVLNKVIIPLMRKAVLTYA